jgi:hypothetical protein
MTKAAATRPGVTGCLLCCRPIEATEPRCPAFALAGVVAHAGCGGRFATGRPACAGPAAGRSEAAA